MNDIKFSVGDIWLNRIEEPNIITKMTSGDYPIIATNTTTGTVMNFSRSGEEVSYHFDSDLDLIVYIGKTKDYPEYIL